MTPQTITAHAQSFLAKIGAGYDLHDLHRLRRNDYQAAKRLRKILTARRSRSIAQHPDARGTPTKEGNYRENRKE